MEPTPVNNTKPVEKKKREPKPYADPLGSKHKLFNWGEGLAAAAIGAGVGFTTDRILNSISTKYHNLNEKVRLPSVMAAAALIGSAIYVGNKWFKGTGYNYSSYSVPKSKDVNIILSGATGGDWAEDNLDVKAFDEIFGKGQYALFSFDDLEEAKAYLASVPNSKRIRIIGHSMGGPAAYQLADFAADIGKPIARLDTLDPVGKRIGRSGIFHGKPATVKEWYNWYPDKYDLSIKKSNMAARMGGAFQELEEAENNQISGEKGSHRYVRFAMPDNKGRIHEAMDI